MTVFMSILLPKGRKELFVGKQSRKRRQSRLERGVNFASIPIELQQQRAASKQKFKEQLWKNTGYMWPQYNPTVAVGGSGTKNNPKEKEPLSIKNTMAILQGIAFRQILGRRPDPRIEMKKEVWKRLKGKKKK
jgi:hypothetical protein